MNEPDPYFHRSVALRAGGRRLELATSQELFSSHQVDRGSRLLLRVMSDVLGDVLVGASVLDAGCGYGPLGLGLRAMGCRDAVLVDRDALAVRYSERNAAVNELNGDRVHAHGSVGFDDVEGRFAVVVSNIPGHVSAGVVRHFVDGARGALTAGGRAGFVVVEPLAGLVEQSLASAGATLERRVDDRGHSVWIARFETAGEPHPGGLELYRRGEATVQHGGHTWTLDAIEGVPEFERLSHHTTALLDHLEQQPGGSVEVWNPGQGHVAVALGLAGKLSSLVLADRDLLALRASEAALTRFGVRPESTTIAHALEAPVQPGPVDLAVDLLRRREPAGAAVARIEATRSRLSRDGCQIVAGPPVSVRRVETALTAAGIPVRRIASRRATLLRVVR